MNFPTEFDILVFDKCPYTQVFRYKRNWWRRSHFNKGELLIKWSDSTEDSNLVIYGQYVSINENELVATERSCLTRQESLDRIIIN